MRYKVLKSVAHNEAAQFCSTQHYLMDDHVMSHLIRAAATSGQTEFHLDLRSGSATPPELLTPPISEALRASVYGFSRQLETERVDPLQVAKAEMVLRLAANTATLMRTVGGSRQVPYECVVTIVDDRGKEYVGRVAGEWYMGDHAQRLLVK